MCLTRLLSKEMGYPGGDGEGGDDAQAADVSGQDAKAIVIYLKLMEHRMHHRIGHIDQEVNSMRNTLQENFQELKRVMRMLATFLRDMRISGEDFNDGKIVKGVFLYSVVTTVTLFSLQ